MKKPQRFLLTKIDSKYLVCEICKKLQKSIDLHGLKTDEFIVVEEKQRIRGKKTR